MLLLVHHAKRLVNFLRLILLRIRDFQTPTTSCAEASLYWHRFCFQTQQNRLSLVFVRTRVFNLN